MKYIRTLLITLCCMLLLASCGVDAGQYLLASLDAVCRSDYAEYSRLTGISTGVISQEQDLILETQADRLITLLGGEGCSADMRGKYINFLKTVYAGAKYEVDEGSAKGEETSVTVYPITLLASSAGELQEYQEKFNASNEEFAYASLSQAAYTDKYLDGLLSLLSAHLASIEYDSGQTIPVKLLREENGLYTIEPDTLRILLETMLPVPG